MTSAFVLAMTLIISDGVSWTVDWKFESQRDCLFIADQAELLVVSEQAKEVKIETLCEYKEFE
jgi:hypothetical protein